MRGSLPVLLAVLFAMATQGIRPLVLSFWQLSKNAECGYHCSIRPMNQKAWIDVGSPRFSYLQPIQHIGVVASRTKPVISPTYRRKRKTYDMRIRLKNKKALFDPQKELVKTIASYAALRFETFCGMSNIDLGWIDMEYA